MDKEMRWETGRVRAADSAATGNMSSALAAVLSEKPVGVQQLAERWEKSFGAIFLHIAGAVSQFFLSHVKTREVEQIQSQIYQCFNKTNEIKEIKMDYQQQNAFLMGYCHAINQQIDAFESEIAYEKNEEVKAVIASYKYVTPILKIVGSEFEISHKELADQIGTSESSLSNLMRKIEKYHFFNITWMGKNKYYSIAYPNGEAALKFVEKQNKVSADGYTDLLLEMMDSLIKISTCDEFGKNYAMKQCEKMIREYTTKPAKCIRKLNELAYLSQSERVYYISLTFLETKVKKTVTVFTKDFESEKNFIQVIIENLEKNIQYRWLVMETEEMDSVEKLQEKLYGQIRGHINLSDKRWEKIKRNMHCHLMPLQETERLLGDIYDAVIYDGDEGFSCVDTTIENKTPYIQMARQTLKTLNQYAQSKIIC